MINDFVHPWILVLIPVVLTLWFYFRRWKEEKMPFFRISTTQGFGSTWRTRLAGYLPYLFLAGLLLIIVAMAGPRRFLREEVINADGIDIMLAMDISPSMLSRDFTPDRLEVSKRVAESFVEKRQYDRIGLTLFSGEAYTQSPLTTDHAIIKTFLANIQAGQIKSGTAIGMGLANAINRLKDSESKTKLVILLTDGENNTGYIDPGTAMNIAVELGVKVYTIGVGSIGMALSPVDVDLNGKYIYGPTQVTIDEDLLTEIADRTGGRYYRAIDEKSLLQIYDEIDQLEKTKIEARVFRRFSDEFRFVLMVSLSFLLLYYILNHTALNRFP